jgi:DNA-directed RNA polymerase
VESFEQVAAQYEPMINKVMNNLTIYKNKDEFFQLGLISLWEAWEKFDSDKGKFVTFAFSYVKGKMLKELSKQTACDQQCVYPKEEFWGLIEAPLGSQPIPINNLFSICGTLTENQKKWVIYTLQFEMSVQEIAAKEEVSLSAVKAWRRGAREKLKAYNFKDSRLEDFLL